MAPVFLLLLSFCWAVAGEATEAAEETCSVWDKVKGKMEKEELSPDFVASFKHSYDAYVAGNSGAIPEGELEPIAEGSIPSLAKMREAGEVGEPSTELLDQFVMFKLNGGLGTSMGLEKAKSLLTVRNGTVSFLDLIAQQVLAVREKYGHHVRFTLMNSFSTSADTLALLKDKYPALAEDEYIEVVQNKAPKIERDSFEPATHAPNPKLEWAPPGHGDLYATLKGSGMLEKLVSQGYKYMFVSNSDNLGANLDLDILTHFARSEAPFMMELCERTESDKKGGHLATRKSDGRLILREVAQTLEEDEPSFQNISKHRYFNTNNLWLRLDKLLAKMNEPEYGGALPLPLIVAQKTVDPKDDESTAVVHLETAMGAAIQFFDGAKGLVVPRARFSPVKKTHDLLALRSDAFTVTPAFTMECTTPSGKPPLISLDKKHYKLVSKLEAALLGEAPSLRECTALTVTGPIAFAPSGIVLKGDVTIKNEGTTRKVVPAGVYGDGTVLDLTTGLDAGELEVHSVPATPIPGGQTPGTSGLRAKTASFMSPGFLDNFVHAALEAFPASSVQGGTLVVGGDGRFFSAEALQKVARIAVGHGVAELWLGQHNLISTPAASALIRQGSSSGGGGGDDAQQQQMRPFGAVILSASHNPAGLHEDFGVKINGANGAPAPASVTAAIAEKTRTITATREATNMPTLDVSTVGTTVLRAADGSRNVTVRVIDPVEDYLRLLKTVFDFAALRAFLQRRPDFTMAYDSMWAVQGPYAERILGQELGLKVGERLTLLHGTPKPDFGGGHADPNLAHAGEMMALMGVDAQGQPVPTDDDDDGSSSSGGGPLFPSFGAAADGDGDRNMIFGNRTFVTPSDSLALLAAYVGDAVPWFRTKGGVNSVARSMPTARAVDVVAQAHGMRLFEVPTGWKYFGNLMDAGPGAFTPLLCGEESFGTSSDHVREKDGMWAALAWLSVLAYVNPPPAGAAGGQGEQAPPPPTPRRGGQLIGVDTLMADHWAKYGRHYSCRYDYEGIMDVAAAQEMMAQLQSKAYHVSQRYLHARAFMEQAGSPVADAKPATLAAAAEGLVQGTIEQLAAKHGLRLAEGTGVFEYRDIVDHSLTKNQGVRLVLQEGARHKELLKLDTDPEGWNARLVFRLSGTGVSGATLRVYLERYAPPPFPELPPYKYDPTWTDEEEKAANEREQVRQATPAQPGLGLHENPREALAGLGAFATEVAEVFAFTGFEAPTTIT